MQKIFFGEFLIEKKLITVDQLVTCLIEQMNTQEIPANIALKNKILNSDDLLMVFRKQQSESKDFISSYRECSFYSESKEKEILSLLAKEREPLGQILLKNNYVDLETMTKQLDEFVSQVGSEKEEIKTEEVVEEKSNDKEVFAEDASEFTSSLKEIVNDSFFSDIENLSNFVAHADPDNDEILKTVYVEIYQKVHQVFGGAKLYSMEQLCSFLEKFDAYFEKLANGEKKLDAKGLEDLSIITNKFFSFLKDYFEKNGQVEFNQSKELSNAVEKVDDFLK